MLSTYSYQRALLATTCLISNSENPESTRLLGLSLWTPGSCVCVYSSSVLARYFRHWIWFNLRSSNFSIMLTQESCQTISVFILPWVLCSFLVNPPSSLSSNMRASKRMDHSGEDGRETQVGSHPSVAGPRGGQTSRDGTHDFAP